MCTVVFAESFIVLRFTLNHFKLVLVEDGEAGAEVAPGGCPVALAPS